MTQVEATQKHQEYLGSLKWSEVERFEPDGRNWFEDKYGDRFFCCGRLGNLQGYVMMPILESVTENEPFLIFNYHAGEDMAQMVLACNEDERKYWRGMFRWLGKDTDFQTAKKAFNAIDALGCPFDLVTVPASERDKLNDLRAKHREKGKQTTNRKNVGAYT